MWKQRRKKLFKLSCISLLSHGSVCRREIKIGISCFITFLGILLRDRSQKLVIFHIFGLCMTICFVRWLSWSTKTDKKVIISLNMKRQSKLGLRI